MAIAPAHRCLQDEGEPVEADLQRLIEPAHRHGPDVPERHLEACDRVSGGHAAIAAAAPRRLGHSHARSSGSCEMGRSAMRARTSASQACGSTSLSFAVVIRVYMKAALSPPRSEPQYSHDLRPRATPRSRALLNDPAGGPLQNSDHRAPGPNVSGVLLPPAKGGVIGDSDDPLLGIV
jgi:hypothetical protein